MSSLIRIHGATHQVIRTATFAITALIAVLSMAFSAPSQAVTGCGFNVDALGGSGANGAADVTSDGLLFLRYAQGLTGAALIQGTRVDQTPANLATVVAAINTHMASYSAAHDMDASGGAISVNDATIIARYLAGYRGAALTAGLALTGSRVLATDIQAYIVAGCPTNTLPLTCTLSGPSAIALGATGNLNATCTSNGSAVTGLTFNWLLGSGLSTASGCGASSTACSVNGVTSGATSVSLSASKAGYATASTTMSVAVGVANVTPQVGALANVTTSNGGRAVVGSPYTLRVPVTDTGTISVAVAGVSGATTSCSGTTSQSCDITWTPTSAGLQSITLTITDSQGATTTTRTTVAVQQTPAADSMENFPTADAPTTSLVGKVAGSFSVSEGGSAGYSIPIQVAPGVNGLQPNLAFGYSSGGSYGSMGIGWSVSGLGAITRCPNTIAQDGFRAPVNYDNQSANDAYCLGGQRLVPVSDEVSAGNITITYKPPITAPPVTVAAKKQLFRTEVESYARITGYKEWPQITAGFSRFVVETKDGRVMHYSRRFRPMTNGYDTCLDVNQPLTCTNGVIANRVKIFVLDRVEDLSGNVMDIEYHTTRPTNTTERTYVDDWDVLGTVAQTLSPLDIGGNGSYPPTEILPKVIKYAGGHEVHFIYDEHPLTAQMRAFDSGAGEGVITQRLIGIDVKTDGTTLAKRYALGYDTNVPAPNELPVSLSHTGRTRLISVKECYGAADTTCLPATEFQWQGTAITSFSSLQTPTSEPRTWSADRLLVGDIRGNGRSSVIMTDYDGSGRLNTTLRICDTAQATSTAAGSFTCADQVIPANQTLNTKGNTYLADVNGDGKADLVFGNAVAGDHYVCLANSDGSGFSTCSSAIQLGQTVNNGLLQGDFDGDGRIDVLAYRPFSAADTLADGTRRHKFALYRGTATGGFVLSNTIYFPASPKEQLQGSLDQGDLRKRFFVADFNGDGSADVMQRMIGAGGNTALDQWRICYSRSDSAIRFDCPRDVQTIVAGTGVSVPPPVMQTNASYQCSIQQSALPAGGTVSWGITYAPVTSATITTSRADMLDNGVCSSSSGITWYGSGTAENPFYVGEYSNAPPTACNNGFSLSLLTASDPSYPTSGAPGDQTITVSRAAGSSYSGNIVISHLPQSGTGILGLTNVPAGVICSQSKPASVTGPAPHAAEDMQFADFNGDGLADVATPVDANTTNNGKWQVCLSTGDGGFERWTGQGARTSTCAIWGDPAHPERPPLMYAKGDAVVTGDFDGDGRSDMLAWQRVEDGTNGWQIAYARGAKSSYANAANVANTVSFAVQRNISAPTPSVSELGANSRVGDFNGDGISDLTLRVSESGPLRILSPSALNGTTGGARQEMINRVTDGLGAVTEFDYAPITDSSVYNKTPTIANTALAANELDAQSPMQVVKSVRADNGLNCAQGGATCPWHTTTFKYYGLRATTNGRGLLGFSQRDVTENFGTYIGSTSKTAYNNEVSKWWQAGSPKKVIKTHPNAGETTKRLSEASMTYHPPRITNGFNATAPLKIYEVFSAGSTQSAWDLDGTSLPSQSSSTPTWDANDPTVAIGRTSNDGDGCTAGAALPCITTVATTGYDVDGNVLRTSASTTHAGVTHSKSSVNTYGFRVVTTPGASISRGEWILARLTRSVVTHSKTGTSDITRVSAFTYYGQDTPNLNCEAGTGNGTSNPTAAIATAPKGFVCDEIVEPDFADTGDQTLWSSTRHRYNTFGHRVTSAINYKAPLNQGDLAGYTGVLTREMGSTSFGANGRFPVTVTNALGDSETRTFHPMFGGITTLVGPNGLLTESTYDAFGRKIRERSFAGNTNTAALVSDASTLTQSCVQADPLAATNAAYASASSCNAGETHRKRTRASGGGVGYTFHDRLQREVRTTTQAFLTSTAASPTVGITANEWVSASVTYDTRGRKLTTTKPTGDGTATTTLQYDDLERVTKETLVGNHGTTLSPAVPSITAVTDTTYSGLTSTVIRRKAANDPTDRTDQTTVRETDSQGKVVKVTDALLGVTTFVHDAMGNLISVVAPGTPAGNTTESMTYDARGRKTGLVSLQAGTYAYRYNGLGELIRQGDKRQSATNTGWDTLNSYDALGRLVQRDEREGTSAVSPIFSTSWQYDSGAQCGQRTKGKLCAVNVTKFGFVGGLNQANGASSSSTYTYDAVGRLERSESAINLSDPVIQGKPNSGPKRFVNTTYFDTNSRPQQIGTPGGVVFTNHYAPWGGSLYKVTDQAGTITHWQANSRYTDGQTKTSTINAGAGASAALTTTKALDGLGRIDGLKSGTAGNTTLIQNANYDIDSFGNLVARSDLPTGGLSNAAITITAAETYLYDKLNRVTGKNAVANSVATYDAIGNILTKAGGGAYSYDAVNKRVTSYAGRGYWYDGNGNLFDDGQRGLEYTPWNLPWAASRGANLMTWDYDHAHQRSVERSGVHGTTFFAPGFELVVPAESTEANPKTIERTYIPSPDGAIGTLTRTNVGNNNSAETVTFKTEYWFKDHLGSLVATADQSGNITQRFRFDPWGKRECLTALGAISTCSSNGSTGNEERGFTGHEMLDEIGLIHMNGRLYDPELGRFIQADPIIQNPMDGQNYNRYAYVQNNPLSYTDPSGFSRWTKWRRPIIGLIAAIAVPWAAAEFVFANAAGGAGWALELTTISSQGTAALTSGAQAVANMAGGFAAGGIQGGNIQSAVIGAVTAGLQFGVGEALGHSTPSIFGANAGVALQKMAAHAAIGCASAAASGGSCKAGAAAAGFSSLAGGSLPGADNILGRALIGAVAAKLAGGKAEQGALLAAMEGLYNDCRSAQQCWHDTQVAIERGYEAGRAQIQSAVDSYIAWRQSNFDRLGAAAAGDASAGIDIAFGMVGPASVGARIAAGHSLDKHVLGVKAFGDDPLFRGLGIRTTAQLASHIDDVIANPTAVRQLNRNRTAYFQESTSTVVIVNPAAADMGTAFQPRNARSYFNGLK